MMSDSSGGDLSDVDDFGDLEMIMQQVQAEQEEEEAKRVMVDSSEISVYRRESVRIQGDVGFDGFALTVLDSVEVDKMLGLLDVHWSLN
ncbi:hypothetical protein Tco_0443130 [Tanacetum coccineum]